MKPNKVIFADLDEIVFENRERNYGAYVLRKSYPWYLITALAAVCHLFLLVVCWPMISNYIEENDLDRWNLNKSANQVYMSMSPWSYLELTPQKHLRPSSDELHIRLSASPVYGYQYLEEMPLALNLSRVQGRMNELARKQLGLVNGKASVRIWIDEKGNYKNHQIKYINQQKLIPVITAYISDLHFIPARHRKRAVATYVDVFLTIGK